MNVLEQLEKENMRFDLPPFLIISIFFAGDILRTALPQVAKARPGTRGRLTRPSPAAASARIPMTLK